MNAGRRVLLAVLQRMTGREMALRVRVSPMAVSYWRSGLRNPSPHSRALLERHCGIPADLWDLTVQRPTGGPIFAPRGVNTRR